MAKYAKIAEVIRERILSNTYTVDAALPDQVNLAKEFETSRMTIARALNLLSEEGLVYSKQGSGTYVRKNAIQLSKLDVNANGYLSITDQLLNRDGINYKILKFDVRFPSEIECEKLLIKKADPVYDIERVRLLDKKPLLIMKTVMPVNLIPNITEDILLTSISRYIKEELGLSYGGANRRIKADKPSAKDQEYLECNVDDPVLEIKQVRFLNNGDPFEYAELRYRYDMGEISIVNLSK